MQHTGWPHSPPDPPAPCEVTRCRCASPSCQVARAGAPPPTAPRRHRQGQSQPPSSGEPPLVVADLAASWRCRRCRQRRPAAAWPRAARGADAARPRALQQSARPPLLTLSRPQRRHARAAKRSATAAARCAATAAARPRWPPPACPAAPTAGNAPSCCGGCWVQALHRTRAAWGPGQCRQSTCVQHRPGRCKCSAACVAGCGVAASSDPPSGARLTRWQVPDQYEQCRCRANQVCDARPCTALAVCGRSRRSQSAACIRRHQCSASAWGGMPGSNSNGWAPPPAASAAQASPRDGSQKWGCIHAPGKVGRHRTRQPPVPTEH